MYIRNHPKPPKSTPLRNHPNPPFGVIRYFNDIQCYWCVPVTVYAYRISTCLVGVMDVTHP